MKIIVCIKQVPDAKDVRLDPETNTLAREGVVGFYGPGSNIPAAADEILRLVRERREGEEDG